MIQKWYKAAIIAKFMDDKEMADFDTKYQSVKAPTANNLGQSTLNQLVEAEVRKALKKMAEESLKQKKLVKEKLIF